MGKIREYQFVTGIETSTIPDPGTPSAANDTVSLGFLNKKSNWAAPVASYAAMRALDTDNRSDNQMRIVDLNPFELWKFDGSSTDTDDGATVLLPDDLTGADPGRWLVLPSGGSSTNDNITITSNSAVATLVAGENIAQNDAVCLDFSSGVYKVYKATSGTGSRKNSRIGLATASATSGSLVTVMTYGFLSGLSSLVVGNLYYVGSTAGSITANPTDFNPAIVGQAISTTVLFVDRNIDENSTFALPLLFVRALGGTTGVTKSNGVNTVEHFNFTSWSAGTADTTARMGIQLGEAVLNSTLIAIDAVDTSNAVLNSTRHYNKSAWSAGTNRTTARWSGGITLYNGLLYVYGGSTTNATSGGTDVIDSYNGSSWTHTVATGITVGGSKAGFTQGGLAHWAAGLATGGGGQTNHITYNGVATSTLTDNPVATLGCAGMTSPSNKGMIGNGPSNTGVSNTYEWNGSAWGSSIAIGYTVTGDNSLGLFGGQGFTSNTNACYINAGGNGNTTSTNATAKFNGTSFSSDTSSTNSIAGPCSGIF